MIDEKLRLAFLADILEDPTNKGTRLIYADYLMEYGDEVDHARGLFIKMQSTILESKEPFRDYGKIVKMITQWQPHWLAREGIFFEWSNSVLDWRHGFLCDVECSIARWILSGSIIVRRHPVQLVQLRNGDGEHMTLRQYFEEVGPTSKPLCPQLYEMWYSNTFCIPEGKLSDSELLIKWANEVVSL